MFLDIVSFTAWSSEREPSQVFVLLETIYQSFDRIAAKLGVFKVETIGGELLREFSCVYDGEVRLWLTSSSFVTILLQIHMLLFADCQRDERDMRP